MYGYTSTPDSNNAKFHASFMETNESHLDHLILLILESLPNILGKSSQSLDSILTSYEVSSILKYTGDIEKSVDTKSGLINIIQIDGISKRCAIYPNSLHSSDLLTERCNELFLKISDSKWINQEGDVLIKKNKVYGLLSFFSFELV